MNQKIVTRNGFDSIFTRNLIYFFISFTGIGLYILVIEYFFSADFLRHGDQFYLRFALSDYEMIAHCLEIGGKTFQACMEIGRPPDSHLRSR